MAAEAANPQVEQQTKYPALQKAMGITPEKPSVVDPAPVEPVIAASVENTSVEPQPNVEPQVASKKIDFSTLTEEERELALAELTGGKIKKLSDLDEPAPKKTAAELEEEKKKRDADMLTWALESNRFTPEEYQQAIIGKSKGDREIALELFGKELREEDPKITDEEIGEAFKDAYGEHLEPTDRGYKIGQRRMKQVADAYKASQFGKIDSLEADYEAHTASQSEYKTYKGLVKNIAADAPRTMPITIPFTDVDGGTADLEFTLNVDDKTVKRLVDELSDETAFKLRAQYSGGKVSDKVLRQEFQQHLKGLLFDSALPAIAEHFAKEAEKRTIAIMGNKRNSLQTLNDGRQNTDPNKATQNQYPALRKAMSERK